jgi:hypothetical protein
VVSGHVFLWGYGGVFQIRALQPTMDSVVAEPVVPASGETHLATSYGDD